ncbi:hypothetical protein ABH940_007145 [Streptacidiphilus sp. BW17]|uniref:hypothetical protein n=1 Tax=Streptacidiphilus sp. BW17 TaxID=3156274 RepID=UPI0035121684
MPSRPTRTFNCGAASAEHRRLAATAFAPDPAVHAITPAFLLATALTMIGLPVRVTLRQGIATAVLDAGLPTTGDQQFLNGRANSLV